MGCPDCGSSSTEYVAEVSAEICTDCGTLVQNQGEALVDLSESQIYDEGRARVTSSVFVGGGTKGYSGRVQASKCHNLIEQLCSSLHQPSLASRACHVFDNVMRVGELFHGRTSRLVVGASTSIAMRESGNQECLAEIAVRLGVRLPPLTKMFVKAKAMLDIQLPANDPSLHFPGLLKAISDSLKQDDTSLSTKLRSYLKSVPLLQVSRLATSLAAIPRDLALHQNRAFPAVASALLVMAFEGEVGKVMPNYAELISLLAGRAGCGKKTLEERYRELSRLVEDWRSHLPWIPTAAKQKHGSPRRDANARYLKDVITFQTQLKIKALEENTVDFPTPDDGDDEEFLNGDNLPHHDVEWLDALPEPIITPISSPRPTKRRRLSPSIVSSADSSKATAPSYDDQVYLSNAGRPDNYVRRLKRPGSTRKEAMQKAISSLLSLMPDHGGSDSITPPNPADTRLSTDHTGGLLRQAVLSQPSFAAENTAPGRLTALSVVRGGEEHVEDDDLFEPGELEALFRDESERVAVEAMWTAQERMHEVEKQCAIPPALIHDGDESAD